MMKRKSWLITISIALIVGCSSPSSLPVGTATEEQAIASITLAITSTAPPVSTETSTSATPSEIASTDVVQNCLQVEDKEIPLNEITNHGTVVVGGGLDESPYILDLQTGSRYDLSLDDKVHGGFLGLHVSPDGKSLAYIEGIESAEKYVVKEKIWVVDARGKVFASQMINPEVLHDDDWRWFDNERIQFNFKSITIKDGTVAIYSPFKNEWEYISNKLSNFYRFYDLDPSWWLVNYNSDLEWVVYLGEVEEFRTGSILWDVKLQNVIWQSVDSSARVKIPRWSPSGSEIAVPFGGNVNLIQRNGDIKLTPDLGADSEIMGLTWSPDGNYIALLVRFNQPEIKGYLMVYDVQRDQILDYCIESNNLMGVFPPVWSLDSRLVSFRTILMKDNGPSENLILLDVQNKIAHKLPENMEPLEWMNSIP